jgi:ABC-2 type transport system permease protein
MNKTIIQFEYKYWLRRPVTILLILLWIAILFFAVGNSAGQLKERRVYNQSLQKEQVQRLQKHVSLMDSFATGKKAAKVFWDDARNAYDIGNFYGKRYLLKEPLRLAPLSLGQSNLHYDVSTINTAPDSWFMTLKKAHKLNNPVNSIFGDFDPASAIVLLLPLLIIACNFQLLSAEKEEGRLPLLLVQGISLKSFLYSKTIFRFLVTTLVTWVALAAACSINGFNFFSDWKSAMLFAAILFLYSAFWHLACIIANLYRKSSDFNAGLLFAAWIAFAIVIPALGTATVSAIKPIPGKVKLIDEVRETLTDFDRKNSQILDQFYNDHPQFAIQDSSKMMPLFMYKYMIKHIHTLQTLTPLMNQYRQKAIAQSKAGTYVATLSPAMLFQETTDELSGHSQTQFLLFQQCADSANLSWNNYFTPLGLANRYLTTNEFKNLPMPVWHTRIDKVKMVALTAVLFLWVGLLGCWLNRKLKRYKLI